MADKQTKQLERLLTEAARRCASDLHLIPGEPPVYRVGGELQRAEEAPLSAEDVESIIREAFGLGPTDAIQGPKSVIAMCGVPGMVEGRICVAKAMGDLTATIRLMPTKLPDPATARVPQPLLDAALSPNGLVIVSGEAGSGKTTVAYMLLEHINTHKPAHIFTITDSPGMRLAPKRAIIRAIRCESLRRMISMIRAASGVKLSKRVIPFPQIYILPGFAGSFIRTFCPRSRSIKTMASGCRGGSPRVTSIRSTGPLCCQGMAETYQRHFPTLK